MSPRWKIICTLMAISLVLIVLIGQLILGLSPEVLFASPLRPLLKTELDRPLMYLRFKVPDLQKAEFEIQLMSFVDKAGLTPLSGSPMQRGYPGHQSFRLFTSKNLLDLLVHERTDGVIDISILAKPRYSGRPESLESILRKDFDRFGFEVHPIE